MRMEVYADACMEVRTKKVFMAYIVMACTNMAFIAMALIVMASTAI